MEAGDRRQYCNSFYSLIRRQACNLHLQLLNISTIWSNCICSSPLCPCKTTSKCCWDHLTSRLSHQVSGHDQWHCLLSCAVGSRNMRTDPLELRRVPNQNNLSLIEILHNLHECICIMWVLVLGNVLVQFGEGTSIVLNSLESFQVKTQSQNQKKEAYLLPGSSGICLTEFIKDLVEKSEGNTRRVLFISKDNPSKAVTEK